MFCPNCATKNQNNATFCKSCGNKMANNTVNVESSASTQRLESKNQFSLLEPVKRVFAYIGEIILSIIVGAFILFVIRWAFVYFTSK